MILLQADSPSPAEGLGTQRSEQVRFRPDIEGLRAVAVVAVVLFHADVPGVDGGFVGVDVFFVISGFLITGLLWREVSTTGSVGLRNFYGARARRLLPASATVGVITMIVAAVLLPPLQARTVIDDGIASALYVSNYWFIQQGVDYFGGLVPPSPFQHYWSLGVEEQFYLVWPAVIIGTAWLIRRVRRPPEANVNSRQRPYLVVLALIAASSFALSFVVTDVAPPIAFFSLPTRAWQLATGGLVALTASHWRRLPARPAALTGWAGLLVILVASNQLSPSTLYPGTAALLPTFGALLVIGAGCATPSQGCGRMLGSSPMRAIGRISYSWYLWHWPMLLLTPALLGHPLGLAARFTAALASGVLAVLTLRFIENPLRFADRVRRSARTSLALGGGATAVAVCVGVALLVWVPTPVGRGAPGTPLTITAAPPPAGSGMAAYNAAVQQAFAQVHAALAASDGLKSVPSNLDPALSEAAAEHKVMFRDGCMRNFFQDGQPECATGDTASTTTVALVGDSTAAMWSPAFQQAATQRNWRLEMLAKAGCPLLDLHISSPALHREYAECTRWRGQILARLNAEHPRLIVLSVMRRYGERYLTFIKLVRTWAMDFGEGFGEFGGWGLGGGQGLAPGLDGDGAVAACGTHEFLDTPTSLSLNPVADRQGGEHDRQVRVDGVAGAVINRAGLQIVLGHPEALLDTPELVVGADDEIGGLAGQVGGVALPPCQRPGLGLQLAVHGLGRPAELDEPIPFHRCMSFDGALCFGDLLINPTQRAAGPIVAKLVVHEPIRDPARLLRTAGRPRLGQHQLIRNCLVGVLVAPLTDHVGQKRDAGAEDERQSRGLQRDLVGFGDHAGISDDGDVGELVSGFERIDDRQHGGGLGFVALEGLHPQGKAGGVGEQSDRDLRIQAAFLGESGLAESVTGISFEVQRRHVVKHQSRRTQRGVSRARSRKRLLELRFGIHRQPTVQCRIRGAGYAGLVENSQRVSLAGGLDDPRQHQLSEHLIPVGGLVEAQQVVGTAQRVPQLRRARGGDRQRLGRRLRRHAEVEFGLSGGQSLASCGFQDRQTGRVVS